MGDKSLLDQSECWIERGVRNHIIKNWPGGKRDTDWISNIVSLKYAGLYKVIMNCSALLGGYYIFTRRQREAAGLGRVWIGSAVTWMCFCIQGRRLAVCLDARWDRRAGWSVEATCPSKQRVMKTIRRFNSLRSFFFISSRKQTRLVCGVLHCARIFKLHSPPLKARDAQNMTEVQRGSRCTRYRSSNVSAVPFFFCISSLILWSCEQIASVHILPAPSDKWKKWCCDNTRTATATQDESPQLQMSGHINLH